MWPRDSLTSCRAINTLTHEYIRKAYSGGLEHRGVVTQLIREARDDREDLVVIWLDLTNPYGSIPHQLVEMALERYHVPQKVKDLILDYNSKFSLRVLLNMF